MNDLWSLNAQALMVFFLAVIALSLVYIAFYKKPPKPRSK